MGPEAARRLEHLVVEGAGLVAGTQIMHTAGIHTVEPCQLSMSEGRLNLLSPLTNDP